MSSENQEKIYFLREKIRSSKNQFTKNHKNKKRIKDPAIESKENIDPKDVTTNPNEKRKADLDLDQPLAKKVTRRTASLEKDQRQKTEPETEEPGQLFKTPSSGDVETPAPRTPVRQRDIITRYESGFKSPSFDDRLKGTLEALVDEGWNTPGKGWARSISMATIFGQRFNAASSTKDSDSLFGHTWKTQQNDLSELESTTPSKPPKKTVVHIWHSVATGEHATSCNILYGKTGAKAAKIAGITNYDDISKALDTLSDTLGGDVIASILFDILNNKELIISEKLPLADRASVYKFLTKLCYLLFGCEASRFESAVITNAMFLDLVIAGKYKMSEIIDLPLSSKGVMPAVRKLNDTLVSDVNPGWRYDLSGKKLQSISSGPVRSILEKNHQIIQDWLKIKKPDSDISELSIGEIGKAIYTSMGAWFHDIETKPFRFEEDPVDKPMDDSQISKLSIGKIGKAIYTSMSTLLHDIAQFRFEWGPVDEPRDDIHHEIFSEQDVDYCIDDSALVFALGSHAD
jgi:hypothetical protein